MKKIKVRIAHAKKRYEVHAFVFGVWAAHRAIVGEGWSVTHLPSGLKLNRREKIAEKAAVAIARRLGRAFPLKTVPALRTRATAIKQVIVEELKAAA